MLDVSPESQGANDDEDDVGIVETISLNDTSPTSIHAAVLLGF